MNKTWTLLKTDVRLIFRDKTLTVFLWAPVLLIAFVRFFVPFVTLKYPVAEDYHPMIMMFAGIQTAIMFGFIISFLILEEKDENVMQVIRVLPVSPAFFIMYRLLFATAFSAFGAFMMIHFGGIAYPGLLNACLLSLQYGLTAPLITLIITTYAQNKVEGMAFFKGVDLLLILPMLSFFIAGPFKYVLAVVPAFWTYTLYDTCLAGGNPAFIFSVGLVVYGLTIWFLFRQFRKRVFDR